MSVDLPGLDEVAIWAHRVTDEGDTVPIVLGVTATAQSAPRDLGVTDEEGRLTAFLGGVPTAILLRPSETRP